MKMRNQSALQVRFADSWRSCTSSARQNYRIPSLASELSQEFLVHACEERVRHSRNIVANDAFHRQAGKVFAIRAWDVIRMLDKKRKQFRHTVHRLIAVIRKLRMRIDSLNQQCS